MLFLDVFARALLAVVFGVAAAGKLRSRAALADFAASLTGFGIGSARARVGAAAAVAVAEAATVVLLATPTLQAGYAVAAVLLTAFASVIAATVRSGRRVRCRCFGTAGAQLTMAHAARNLALAAVAGTALAVGSDGARAAPVDFVVLGCAGALVGWAATRFDDLLFLVGGPARRDATTPRES